MNRTTAGTNQKPYYNYKDLLSLDDPGHRPRTHEEVLAAEQIRAAEPAPAQTLQAAPQQSTKEKEKGAAAPIRAPKNDSSVFPLSALPPAIGNYCREIAVNAHVSLDMVVLPALSVLAICLQKKAVIQGRSLDHTEQLMLYSLTVAPPGSRKSSILSKLKKPIDEYTEQYNSNAKTDIEEYKAMKMLYEKERSQAKDQFQAKRAAQNLAGLQEKHELTMLISDATPESIADQILRNGGKIAMLDAEGGIFKTLGGQYASNGGTGNIDIIVKAYDGESHTITRKTSETVYIPSPAMSMGLMIQPAVYDRFIQKADFSDNGFTQRFLVSFPKELAGGEPYKLPDISKQAEREYKAAIRKLLEIPMQTEPPIIVCNQKAQICMENYFYHLQKLDSDNSGNISKEWVNKQFGRCLRIAGLLHMVEHAASEPLDEKTAFAAVRIAEWSEKQYMHSIQDVITDPVLNTAKQLYTKIIPFMHEKKKAYFTLTDAARCIRPDSDKTGEKRKIFDSAIELLLEAGVFDEQEIKNGKGRTATAFIPAENHAQLIKNMK